MIADYTPTVAELASLIPSRAAGRFTGGSGAPAFPDENRVQAVIEDATGLIAPSLGGDGLDPQFWASAKALIKLQAALLLEPSAWPEQAQPNKNAFAEWLEMLNKRMESTTAAIVRFRDDADDGPGASQHVLAGFPPAGLRRSIPVLSVSITGDVIDTPPYCLPDGEGWPPFGTDW